MHPHLAVGHLVEASAQLVQRYVHRAVDVSVGELAVLADIEDSRGPAFRFVYQRLGQRGEIRDTIGPQRRARRDALDVPGRRTGQVVNPDAGEFPPGLGDLVGIVADQGQR